MRRLTSVISAKDPKVNELLYESETESYYMVTSVWEDGRFEIAKVDLDDTKTVWA